MRLHKSYPWPIGICRLARSCQSRVARPLVTRRPLAALAGLVVGGALACGMLSSRAMAEAIVERQVRLYDPIMDIYYADDPFTTTVNEGIPRLGNSINENQGMMQTNFEGRPDTMGTATTTDDTNVNFDIYVGRSRDGLLIINGGTELRDMHLVIADIAMEPNGQLRVGSGTVRIENPGSLYNNDPFILPYPFDEMGMSPSLVPRPDDVGYDVYVGRYGVGQLAISLGGAAEIQDAVIVGEQSGSNGTLTIDGVGSVLNSGGFEFMSGDDEPHNMFVGRLGSGTLQITNGGRSYNLGAQMDGSMGLPVFGAVVGASFAATTQAAPSVGGNGYAVVDGPSSTWTVGGSLQISGFHDACEGGLAMCDPDEEDLEGDDVIYGAQTGTGHLVVSNGALVSIVTPPVDVDAIVVPSKLDLLIGKEGIIELDGGRIELLGVFPVDPDDPSEIPVQRLERGRVINDGDIIGHGSITTLQFRNRALGEVHVAAGQKLRVTALGDYDPMMMSPPDEYPGTNYGLIDVLGTAHARAEFEFARTAQSVPGLPGVTATPFRNQRHGTVTESGGRPQGDIFVQYGTLRFGSGLENHGNLVFTAGDNIVSGNVFNDVDGQIFVGGNNTTVTFEGMIDNAGSFEFGPNASIVTSLIDFTMLGSGSLSMTIGGTSSGPQVSHLSVEGDLMLDGLLEISLFPGGSTPFSPQPGDTFEIMSAQGIMSGDFAFFDLPFLSPTVGLFAFPDYTQNKYYVTTIGAMPGSGSADLDGDGMIDETDLDIWRQNLGNPGGLGDINGDGIVDGQDFIIWLMQTTPGAASLAGYGPGAAGVLGGAVPEPSSVALVAIGAVLALARRRRSGYSPKMLSARFFRKSSQVRWQTLTIR